MPGPLPKDPKLRQRRNKHVTAAQLPTEDASRSNPVPPLPDRERLAEVWHPKVVEWWESVWRSPMAQEYLGPDMRGGLYLLAELHQCRWTESDVNVLIKLASEIRQQEVRFGLSPVDRRRLQWEVSKGEEAVERTTRRRKSRDLDAAVVKDPRDVLKLEA